MIRKTLLNISYFSITIGFLLVAFQYCAAPKNPFTDPDNVTIELILPDTTGTIIYTRDTIVIKIVVTLTSLIDSVKLTIGVIADSLFTTITDTIPVKYVFHDTGVIPISAIAFCEKGVTKDCQKSLRIYTNLLVPPDTVYTQPLSDTSIKLYWEKISVAKGYRVYRNLSGTGVFSLVQTVTDSLYIDTALKAAATYYYKVSSLDSLNRESDMSSVYSATTFTVPLSKWDEMVWDQDKWE